MIISDETFNGLEWKPLTAPALGKEIQGFTILGSENITEYYTKDGAPATSALLLYLARSEDKTIKIIKIDVFELLDHLQDSEKLINIEIAYIEK